MIDYLLGIHFRTLPNGIIMDVNGVGYGLETPLSTLSKIPALGEKLEVYVYTHVRDDCIRLFGFISLEEKLVFQILLNMPGVGPKVALAMLSTLGSDGIYNAVLKEDLAELSLTPGIGPRLAEKIIVELRPKLDKLRNPIEVPENFKLQVQTVSVSKGAVSNPAFQDLETGLENLGFKPRLISPIVSRLQKSSPDSDLQSLLKKALAELGGKRSGASAGVSG